MLDLLPLIGPSYLPRPKVIQARLEAAALVAKRGVFNGL